MKRQQSITESLGRATKRLTAAQVQEVLSSLPPSREKFRSIKSLQGSITHSLQRERTLANDENWADAEEQQKFTIDFIQKKEFVEKVAGAFHRCDELIKFHGGRMEWGICRELKKAREELAELLHEDDKQDPNKRPRTR